MKIKFFIVFLSLVLDSFLAFNQEIGYPIITNYLPKDYANGNQVTCALQDHRGIMYFGAGFDIMEFDGVNWRHIPKTKKVFSYDLAQDNNGRIYVASIDDIGYLDIDSSGIMKYYSLEYLLPEKSRKMGIVYSARITSQYVYFRTYEAIFQYMPTNNSVKVFKAPDNGRFHGDFVHNDQFYTRLANSGLVKISKNTLEFVNQTGFFNEERSFITALHFDSSNFFIPTRVAGIYLYNPDTIALPKKFELDNNDFLTDNILSNVTNLSDEYLVLTSLKKGALLIDKKGITYQYYNETNLLNDNKIYEVTIDKYKNIWFGLGNGIGKTEYSQDLSYWNKYTGLKGTVTSIVRFNNNAYITSTTNVYYIDDSNKINIIEGIPTGQNWHLLVLADNKTLLAATAYGLYEIIDKKAYQIYSGGHAFKIYQSIKNPNRIISTDYDKLISLRKENGRWIFEGTWQGIKDQIRGIIEDSTGNIWLGTFSFGIIKVTVNQHDIVNPKNIKYYNLQHGLSSLDGLLPYFYKDTIVWTSDKGLFTYNALHNNFEKYCGLGEPFCNGKSNVLGFYESNDGKIWISPVETKFNDIGSLEKQDSGKVFWNFQPFRRLPEMIIEAFIVEPSGLVWVGGSEGLFRYDPSKDTKNYSQKYNCLIRKVKIGRDSSIYEGNKIWTKNGKNEFTINYKFRSLRFEYAAPFFDQENKTRYSYQLVGFDEQWSDWSYESRKDYTNLNEGTYIFNVKALNVYNVESTTDSLEVTILPPLYRKWWAYILYILFLGFFIIVFLRFYTRNLIKEKQKLEKIIDERTSEIRLQNEAISAFNHELMTTNEDLVTQRKELDETLKCLKETQNKLVLSEKMASLGVFASGISHEINNPLNFVIGGVYGLESYMEEHFATHKNDLQMYFDAIKEGVQRAYEIVSGLNHFSRSEDFISKNIDLNKLIDNCLLIYLNEITHRIQVIKNYTNESYNFTGNEGKIHQAIFNVITNSIQAIDENGSITIDTYIVKNNFIINIKDDGCGISKENLPKILDPFFTTKEPGEGTGLGLSITYNILTEHNGTIEFESTEGKGTIATISLPIKN